MFDGQGHFSCRLTMVLFLSAIDMRTAAPAAPAFLATRVKDGIVYFHITRSDTTINIQTPNTMLLISQQIPCSLPRKDYKATSVHDAFPSSNPSPYPTKDTLTAITNAKILPTNLSISDLIYLFRHLLLNYLNFHRSQASSKNVCYTSLCADHR